MTDHTVKAFDKELGELGAKIAEMGTGILRPLHRRRDRHQSLNPEMRQIAEVFCRKLNATRGSVRVVLPLQGMSIGGLKGGSTYDPEGDKVFFTPGGAKGSMVALDKMTGKLLWQTRLPAPSSAVRTAFSLPGMGAPTR